MGGKRGFRWDEIQAWSSLNGNLVSWEEASVLREMSKAYAMQYNASFDKAEPQPALDPSLRVDNSMKSFFANHKV